MLWWTSNFMTLGGSMAYTRVKQLEMKQQHENRPKGDLTSTKV